MNRALLTLSTLVVVGGITAVTPVEPVVTGSYRLLHTIPVGGEGSWDYLSVDRRHHRLFSVCANGKAMVFNAGTGKIVAQLPIGRKPDGVVFDPVTQAAISANGEGTLTIMHVEKPDQYRTETIASAPGARTIALDPPTHRLYVSTAELGATPPPTTEVPHPRPAVVPNTFRVLVFGRQGPGILMMVSDLFPLDYVVDIRPAFRFFCGPDRCFS